ncbi:hypothetical protein [Pumilibacter intestinalis]|uniref:hypothetical protein n=1 Tax=Pumilibacter intestinalis TaxID=2941511 RepID=UPI00203D7C26|nr:hypothetical protein [Pumilibacter intestinalis]
MNTFISSIMTLLAADGADFTDLSDTIVELINSMWVPCVAIASALAVAWGIYLGIKYWLAAGDEQKKRSAKSSLISFGVGIIIIFVVAVGAPLGIGALSEWVSANNSVTVLAILQ